MRIKVNINTQDLDLLYILQNSSSNINQILTEAIKQYSREGRVSHTDVVYKTNEKVIIKSSCIQITVNDAISLDWLKSIRSGYRTQVLKTLLRISISNLPLISYTDKCEIAYDDISKHTKPKVDKKIHEIQEKTIETQSTSNVADVFDDFFDNF